MEDKVSEHSSAYCLFHAGSLLGLLFNPEEESPVSQKYQLTQQTTHSSTQKTGLFKNHHCENLKSYKSYCVLEGIYNINYI